MLRPPSGSLLGPILSFSEAVTTEPYRFRVLARDHADPPADKRLWSFVDERDRRQLNYVAELWGLPNP